MQVVKLIEGKNYLCDQNQSKLKINSLVTDGNTIFQVKALKLGGVLDKDSTFTEYSQLWRVLKETDLPEGTIID